MKKHIFDKNTTKKHKIERNGICWANDKGYIRYGMVGGILDHDPEDRENHCCLISGATGRRVKVRYPDTLHHRICAYIGRRIIITGKRHYSHEGKLEWMYAEIIGLNERPKHLLNRHQFSTIRREKTLWNRHKNILCTMWKIRRKYGVNCPNILFYYL